MTGLEIVPSAPALLASLRGFGYTPESAIADLIDNSISAGAGSVELTFRWNHGSPEVLIADDGEGMTREGLIDALRFGGAGPLAVRTANDLGRFGLGLKTASLSQCRRFLVVTARSGEVNCLGWDLDHVEGLQGRWEVSEIDPADIGDAFTVLRERGHGAVVAWSKFDHASAFDTTDEDAFLSNVQTIESHLAMVFHRFLAGDAKRLKISINGRPVRPWDPFLEWHDATTSTPEERLQSPGGPIRIRGYVLPHKDRFQNEEDFQKAGGPAGWNAQQGFYVYRGKRLVVAGGWLGLGGSRAWTRDEASRLARIRIDIAPAGDEAWRIDVKKSLARPPGALRRPLTRIADDVRRRAREVFAWRGGQGTARAATTPDRIWEARETRTGRRYAIKRDHPLTLALRNAVQDKEVLERWLAAAEWSVPVERIWLDVSESGGAPEPTPTGEDLAKLAAAVVELVRTFPGADVQQSIDQALAAFPRSAAMAVRSEVMRMIAGAAR